MEDHEVFRVEPVYPDEIDNPLGMLQWLKGLK